MNARVSQFDQSPGAVTAGSALDAAVGSPGTRLIEWYEALFAAIHGEAEALAQGDRVAALRQARRAEAVLRQLTAALDHRSAPALCASLTVVYGFCSDRVARAAEHGEVAGLTDCVRVLEPIADAWRQAIHAISGGAPDEV